MFIRLLLLLTMFCFGCVAPRTADSCSGVNHTSTPAVGANAEKKSSKRGLFRRNKTVKGEDGYRRKEKSFKTYGTKAEKGKKKEKEAGKAEKKWLLFRKKKAAEKDADDQNKRVFRTNEKKRKKEIKKRSKHPQMGLWPNGKPGR